VFKEVFEKANQLGHYNMMIGSETAPTELVAVVNIKPKMGGDVQIKLSKQGFNKLFGDSLPNNPS
jgi:hypothetical protein